MTPPKHIDLQKDHGLTIEWADGAQSFYPIALLRKMSPSAEARQQRDEAATNPLRVISSRAARTNTPLTALDAEFVGNYALRIRFSDGHQTGLYTWEYLRKLDAAPPWSGGSPDAITDSAPDERASAP